MHVCVCFHAVLLLGAKLHQRVRTYAILSLLLLSLLSVDMTKALFHLVEFEAQSAFSPPGLFPDADLWRVISYRHAFTSCLTSSGEPFVA